MAGNYLASVNQGLRARLYCEMEPSARDKRGLSPNNFVLVVLVLVSLVSFALETEPGISDELYQGIQVFNWFILIVFAIEYVVRVWVAGEDEEFRGIGGRLKYMFTPYAVADLIAFLPELVFLLIVGPTTSERSIAALKALRLFRLLKLARFVPAFGLLGAALKRAGTQLLTSLALAMALVYVSAMLLFFIEGPGQPEAFGSIPRAVWWAIATLTTVGYGDVYPVTALGRVAASIIAIAGIGVVALPAGVFASAFSDEIKEREQEKRDEAARRFAAANSDPENP